MAEKHLAEAGWKTLVTKQKLKDNGLAKALAAYDALGEKGDAAARAKAIQTVSDLATKMKKAAEENDAAVEYLEEVISEAAKAKQTVALLAKKASVASQDEEESEEGELEDADFATRLAASLAKVRAGKGERGLEFMAAPGTPGWSVVLATKVGAKHKALLVKLFEAKKFVEGTCIFEKEAWTFVVPAVKAGMGKGLKDGIKHHTSKNYKVRVRDAAGTTVLDGDTDAAGPEDGGPSKTRTVGDAAQRAAVALAAWQTARQKVVDDLKALSAAIVQAKDPEAKDALVVIGAIVKNLTVSPSTGRQVKELQRYVETDDVIGEAELENPFGLKIAIKEPLTAALSTLAAAVGD